MLTLAPRQHWRHWCGLLQGGSCFWMAASRQLDSLELGKGLFQSRCWPRGMGTLLCS